MHVVVQTDGSEIEETEAIKPNQVSDFSTAIDRRDTFVVSTEMDENQ